MSNIPRYAGVWNSATTYYNDFFVTSPLNNLPYIFYGTSITGGTDPSVNPAWTLAPSGGGGGAGPTGATGPTGPTGGFSTTTYNGILNKLGAFPALPYTSETIQLVSNNAGPTGTTTVPVATFPTASPDGHWAFSKGVGSGASFSWNMYNPRFSSPSAPLPYVKSKVQSAWVVIRPTVNLYLAGYLAINLYSYDDANPPTSGFYNTRWAYSNSSGAVAGATGVNLYAGYTYLIYAYDAPRIVNSAAIGVPDAQVSGLRDPYDIYTDVNHIAFQNCVVAFNPWTNGTNYRTWDAVTAYTINQTVVFAGNGTNYNGLFFIATGSPTVGTAPMVNGVVSANWSLISPQPSSYADQPVLSINLNQSTASAQAVGYVVIDMGFSYGPDTVTTTVSSHINLNV